MKHPCHAAINGKPCGRAKVGDYDPSQCNLCWTGMNDPEYAALWRLKPVPRKKGAAKRSVKPAAGGCCGGKMPYKVEMSSPPTI